MPVKRVLMSAPRTSVLFQLSCASLQPPWLRAAKQAKGPPISSSGLFKALFQAIVRLEY